MHVFCIVLSIISIFYFSIHVIFSYSAFRLQACSIKSVKKSVIALAPMETWSVTNILSATTTRNKHK